MNDEEKRIEIAELRRGLERAKELFSEIEYEQYEEEVNRKIELLR